MLHLTLVKNKFAKAESAITNNSSNQYDAWAYDLHFPDKGLVINIGLFRAVRNL